ncbi:hypothetical protein RJ53_09620 [Methanocalculus chunghsingensis]|uniref:Uncharacterized protein n=1 Tax=Methanocalculus chunghsingensis TaxID=156457 RepID=A0A8J8B7I9_9EURY|nr:hypothetical protein [Methanocalculus chunghsingensis]
MEDMPEDASACQKLKLNGLWSSLGEDDMARHPVIPHRPKESAVSRQILFIRIRPERCRGGERPPGIPKKRFNCPDIINHLFGRGIRKSCGSCPPTVKPSPGCRKIQRILRLGRSHQMKRRQVSPNACTSLRPCCKLSGGRCFDHGSEGPYLDLSLPDHN